MKVLKDTKERTWYQVKEWTTKAGLTARINQCVWKPRVVGLAPSLHPFYTGYVLKRSDDPKTYYDSSVDVHGGVTFEGSQPDTLGTWVGFDMAHLGDEEAQDLDYATEECEKLARQMV